MPRLEALRTRGQANGVPGLELVGPERIAELEPHATGIRGLWSPTIGIVDYQAVCAALADEIRARGGTIHPGREVTAVTARRDELVGRHLVACAGLWVDRVPILFELRDQDLSRLPPIPKTPAPASAPASA